MSAISAAILTGGQSRRMGRNKALLELGSSTVVERVIAAAAPLAAECLLITPDTEAFAHLGLPVHPDLHPQLGPLGGLHTALDRVSSPTVLLLACDLPFVTTGFLRFMVDQLRDHQAVVPRTDKGLECLCAVYTQSCVPAVTGALAHDQRRMTAFFHEVDVRFLDPDEWQAFDPNHTLFTNLNTPEDYQRARELVRREAP